MLQMDENMQEELRMSCEHETPPPLRETHLQIADGALWEVPKYYSDFRHISTGSFGVVCSAFDNRYNVRVAVKKLFNPFENESSAKCTYREIALLAVLHHKNIINLLDTFTSRDYTEIFLIMELCDSDLATFIKKKFVTQQHARFFTYQILRGLKYLHSAGVIHRDLKPTNVTVDQRLRLKLIDFGLARCEEPKMTTKVLTPYYRAPEVILELGYDSSVDIWSTGCILAEMILQKPLFPGKDNLHQLSLICNLIGLPAKRGAEWPNEILNYVITNHKPDSFGGKFSGWPAECLSLLQSMLQMDDRPSASTLLQYNYFSDLSKRHGEPNAPIAAVRISDSGSFEDGEKWTLDDWTDLVWMEMKNFTERQPPKRN